MSGSPVLRKMAVALLALALLSVGAPSAEAGGFTRSGIAHNSWNLLDGLWDSLTAFWSDAGCEIDPSGACVVNPNGNPDEQDDTDAGCEIDPDGRCVDSR